MKLLALECDRNTFKPLRFRPEGLSVIVGDASDREGSANGVGKTLALKLVHHCLGARRDPLLAQGVGDWRFALEFELADQTHRIERNGDGSDITLDGQSIAESALRSWLDRHGPFVLPQEPGFSFRALYARFARRAREDRADPIKLDQEKAHEALARALYLLGADITLVLRKAQRRERINAIESARKLLRQSDTRLRELLRTGMDARAQIAELSERIEGVRRRLETMRVADDYERVRQEADALTRQLRQREARLAQIDFQLAGIEQALQRRADIDREALLAFYRGLERVFRPEALADFEAVESFHRSLAEQRHRRLSRDRLGLQDERSRIEDERAQLARQRDERLAYLGSHHALDDYQAVAAELARMDADLGLLQRYRSADEAWDAEMLELRQALAEDDRLAADYVAEQPLAWADRRFRELIHALYPREAAGIVLGNNTRDNKLRYDLKVQVEGQGSDGINAARIMAFDWLVYRHGAHHAMRHLWHDNGLFDPIDPNQRTAWLRLVQAELAGSGMQYILSINTENYASTRELLGEAGAWLDEAVIVRLRGDADAHKLLGARIGVVEPSP